MTSFYKSLAGKFALRARQHRDALVKHGTPVADRIRAFAHTALQKRNAADRYEERLIELKRAFSQTSFGAAILAFLEEHGTRITFNADLNIDAAAGDDNSIEMNPTTNDALLLSALAHEARHIWQMHILAEKMTLAIPPEVIVARDIFMEADAHAFEQKFVEDYARKTGNAAPLKAFLASAFAADTPLKTDDATRFFHWAGKIRHSPGYKHRALRRVERALACMELQGPDDYAPREYTAAMSVDVARTLDGCWPFTPRG